MTFNVDEQKNFIAIQRVKLRLRASTVGFDLEPDLTRTEPLAIPTSTIRLLNAEPRRLLAVRVRDQGMEPMFFEDDWIVINAADTLPRGGDVYAVNWNG